MNPSRHINLFLLVPMLALLGVSCAKQEAGPQVLATVGERQITVVDFEQEVARRQAARRPVPDREAVLKEMIEREALLQKAAATGLLENPAVRREMDNLLIGKLRDLELEPMLQAVTVSEEEVEAEYQSDIDRYTRSGQVRLALLRLEMNSKASDQKRAELRARMEEARGRMEADTAGAAGEAVGFGKLAIEFSDDQASRYRGGDIGWLEAGRFNYRWPRAVLEAAYGLERGQVSGVIEQDDGFYLAMMTDSREARITPLTTVKANLRQKLLQKKRQSLSESFRAEGTGEALATMDREALAQVTLPEGIRTVARNEELNLPRLPAN